MNVFIKQEGLIVIDVFFYYELCSFVIFIVSWNCTNKVIQWSCVHPISFDYINHLFTLYAQVLHHWNLMIQTPHHNYYPKQIISMIQMLETLLSRHIIVIIAVTIHNDGVHGFNDQSIICVYIYIQVIIDDQSINLSKHWQANQWSLIDNQWIINMIICILHTNG